MPFTCGTSCGAALGGTKMPGIIRRACTKSLRIHIWIETWFSLRRRPHRAWLAGSSTGAPAGWQHAAGENFPKLAAPIWRGIHMENGERSRLIMHTLMQMEKQFGKGSVLQLGSR